MMSSLGCLHPPPVTKNLGSQICGVYWVAVSKAIGCFDIPGMATTQPRVVLGWLAVFGGWGGVDFLVSAIFFLAIAHEFLAFSRV